MIIYLRNIYLYENLYENPNDTLAYTISIKLSSYDDPYDKSLSICFMNFSPR
jgi:hypothetical protein